MEHRPIGFGPKACPGGVGDGGCPAGRRALRSVRQTFKLAAFGGVCDLWRPGWIIGGRQANVVGSMVWIFRWFGDSHCHQCQLLPAFSGARSGTHRRRAVAGPKKLAQEDRRRFLVLTGATSVVFLLANVIGRAVARQVDSEASRVEVAAQLNQIRDPNSDATQGNQASGQGASGSAAGHNWAAGRRRAIQHNRAAEHNLSRWNCRSRPAAQLR